MKRLVSDVSTSRVSCYKAEKGWLIEQDLKGGGKMQSRTQVLLTLRKGGTCQHANEAMDGDEGTERSLQHSLLSK